MVWLIFAMMVLFVMTILFGLSWVATALLSDGVGAWICGIVSVVSFVSFIVIGVIVMIKLQ